MKIKRKILSLLLAVCLTVGVAPTTAFAADTEETSETESSSDISLAIARGEYLTSIWYSAAVAETDNSMRFLLGSVPDGTGTSYITKLTNFGYSDSLYSTRNNKYIHNQADVGDIVCDFSKGCKAEIGTGTTYKVGDTTYGTTQPDIFNNTGWYSNYKTGVLNTKEFTFDELDACSFSFVPVGTNHDDGYYIFVTHTEYISKEYRDFTFSLNADWETKFDYEGDHKSKVSYKLELRYEATTVNTPEYYENKRTVWYIDKAKNDGEYYVYTKGNVYSYPESHLIGGYYSECNSDGCLFLQANNYGLYLDEGRQTPSNNSYKDSIEKLIEDGNARSIMLYGNLSTLTTKTEGSYAGYDAFRLVEDGNVKNIVVKRQGRMTNETTGKTEIGVVKLPGSDNGNLVMWTESRLYDISYSVKKLTTGTEVNKEIKDRGLPKYYRDFEDYTSGYSGTEAAYEKAHPALSPPTGYTEGQNVYQSEYKGKTFYAIRSFNMDYSVTGLASGNSLDVRMGTMEDDAPFASTMDVKSGTAVTEGNWVAFTLPTANQTGYKYTLESVSVTDSSGNGVSTSNLSGYRTGTLSSGATYVYFKMPSYAISVNISVKRESAPINNSAYGRFIISDSGLKYRSSVTANGLTPVKLFLSTDDLGEDGTSWFKIYEDPFNGYCTNNDDYLSYSIASCKWYMKIGENGDYEPLNLSIGYERDSVGAHRATSAVTYLPLLSEETKIYYKIGRAHV